MHQHSTSEFKPSENHPSESGCGHDCDESIALVSAVSKLLTASLDLFEFQQVALDVSTWPLSQALTYCDAYIEFHPSLFVSNLIGGIEVNAEALAARLRWEQGQ